MLVLLMSAVLLALPVMFTISMAVGSKELAKRGVLVTRLSAAEDAATMGRALRGQDRDDHHETSWPSPASSRSSRPRRPTSCSRARSRRRKPTRIPIDLAFLAAAKERHVFDGRPKVAPISFAPFDAKNRRTEAVVEQDGKRLRVMKGAVRTVAEACGLQAPAIEALEARVSASAAKGLSDRWRVARGPETGAPALVGLVSRGGFRRDRTRRSSSAALQERGVAVKMLTGGRTRDRERNRARCGAAQHPARGGLEAASAEAGKESVRRGQRFCGGVSGGTSTSW